jgi:ATP-binding cassette subfamily C protein/ATP-binding cassette subfamily C protein LapB
MNLTRIREMAERIVPKEWVAHAQAHANAAREFLSAYWQTLVTFDASAIEPSSVRRPRTVATAQCLSPFLKALAYRGGDLAVAEAKPHFQAGMDIADLRTSLVNLGYTTERVARRPIDIDHRLMPCLHEESKTGHVAVLLGEARGVIFAFADGHQRALTQAEAERDGFAYFARPIEAKLPRRSWTSALFSRFKSFIAQLVAISALSNVLSIAIPLFVMTVYDRVIASRALDVLPMLLVGIAIAIAADLYLKTLRSRLLGTMAGRIDYLIGTATFAKLIRLPLSYTDGPAVSAQISRLREFQALRDLFAGPAASAVVDFPFTFIALAVVAYIGGWLVVVPVVACVVFAVIGFAGARWLQTYEIAQNASSAQLFNHITDTTMHHEALKREGAEEVWSHRFRLMSAEAATRATELHDRAAAVEALSQTLNNVAALAVLVVGTLMVLNGSITVGALIATMALTWRILSPAQQLFQTLGRLSRLRSSIQSLNQMLRLADEHEAAVPNLARAPRLGRVGLNRVSLRYGKDSDPALVNVSLNVPPGKMIALCGPNGSGKSSVLRVVQGLYQPQAGIVAVDGADIRQLPPKVLRRAIACAPQRTDLFYGTIAQNLRLGDPLAGDEALRAAADAVGILATIEDLPETFNTRIGDVTTQTMPPGFLRQLTIARALVRKAPVLLLDEPEAMLDEDGAKAVQNLLERLRGQRTVLFTSHRPSYIRIADFAVVMRDGGIEFGGTPDGAIEKLLGLNTTGKAA